MVLTADPETSFPDLSYPTNLKDDQFQTGRHWLSGKIADDGAEGLWRVHDGLYDFTDFIKRHPGGEDWLNDTKGTDITEAFESHHISTAPESMLKKFLVREATTPRHSPFTFKDDGFYRVLKSKIRDELKTVPDSLKTKSKRIVEAMMLGMFLTACCACLVQHRATKASLVVASAFMMSCVGIGAHNFIHQRDNWRMYLLNFTFIPSREFRITHALSHHLYPNTLMDFEITSYWHFFQWLPRKDKSLFMRYAPRVYAFLMYALVFDGQILRQIMEIIDNRSLKTFRKEDMIPYSLPLVMYLTSGASLGSVLLTWWVIWHVASFIFLFIGLNAAHHHPDIFHDGDTPLKDRDWGLHQLDAVMDRVDINSNYFTVLTTFGEHGLHHLFPTLDHGVLSSLHRVFAEVCLQFKTELRMTTQFELILGQFRQLARTEPKIRNNNKHE